MNKSAPFLFLRSRLSSFVSHPYTQQKVMQIRVILNGHVGAQLAIALSGILYGTLGYFGTRLIQSGFSVPAMLFWRFLGATVALAWYSHHKNLPLVGQRPGVMKAFLMGVFFYAGSAGFYFLASESIGTGLGMVVFFSFPAFVLLFTRLLDKEPVSKASAVSLLSIFVGMVLLGRTDNFDFKPIGVLMGIIAALCYALYIFFSKRQVGQLHSSEATFYVCAGSTVTFLFEGLFEKNFHFPTNLMQFRDIFAISIFCTALPAFLLLKGLRQVDAGTAAILSVLEPVVTVLVGGYALGEVLGTTQKLGVGVILLGTIVLQLKKRSSPPFG